MMGDPATPSLGDVDDLLRENRLLRTISNCIQALVHSTEEPELLQELCRVIVEDGGYRFAWVGIPEEDAERSVAPSRKPAPRTVATPSPT